VMRRWLAMARRQAAEVKPEQIAGWILPGRRVTFCRSKVCRCVVGWVCGVQLPAGGHVDV
jgi:hypothetical protein